MSFFFFFCLKHFFLAMWRIHIGNGGILLFKGNNTPINSVVTFHCYGTTSKGTVEMHLGLWFRRLPFKVNWLH